MTRICCCHLQPALIDHGGKRLNILRLITRRIGIGDIARDNGLTAGKPVKMLRGKSENGWDQVCTFKSSEWDEIVNLILTMQTCPKLAERKACPSAGGRLLFSYSGR